MIMSVQNMLHGRMKLKGKFRFKLKLIKSLMKKTKDKESDDRSEEFLSLLVIPPMFHLAAYAFFLMFSVIEPVAQFLAGFKERHMLFGNFDGLAGTRIAACSGRALLDGESARATQLDPFALGQRCRDLIENRIDDAFDVALKEVRIGICQKRYELGFYHRKCPRYFLSFRP